MYNILTGCQAIQHFVINGRRVLYTYRGLTTAQLFSKVEFGSLRKEIA